MKPQKILFKPVKNTPLIDIFWGKEGWNTWTRVIKIKTGGFKYLKGDIPNTNQMKEIEQCMC